MSTRHHYLRSALLSRLRATTPPSKYTQNRPNPLYPETPKKPDYSSFIPVKLTSFQVHYRVFFKHPTLKKKKKKQTLVEFISQLNRTKHTFKLFPNHSHTIHFQLKPKSLLSLCLEKKRTLGQLIFGWKKTNPSKPPLKPLQTPLSSIQRDDPLVLSVPLIPFDSPFYSQTEAAAGGERHITSHIMTNARAKNFIVEQVTAHAHSEHQILQGFTTLRDLHEKKLWHQLTLKLEEWVQLPFYEGKESELLALYQNFIADFESKINQLSLVRIVVSISKKIQDPKSRFDFLERVAGKISPEEREAVALIWSTMAWVTLHLGQLDETKALTEKVGKTLEGFTGAEFEVYSKYYQVLSLYYKATVSSTEFYRNSLMYLLYTPLENIPKQEQASLAFDMGIAALVSPDIHNFGELLAHQVLDALEGTPNAWLKPFLFAFNAGDLEKFEQLLQAHRSQIEGQDILRNSLPLLREKISILALMELVFNKPAEGRTLPFSEVAKATRLNEDGVELLVMKALSLHLIRGEIDEVSRVVRISWVQSRVLDINQIKKMHQRMDHWIGGVRQVLNFMQNETAPELLT